MNCVVERVFTLEEGESCRRGQVAVSFYFTGPFTCPLLPSKPLQGPGSLKKNLCPFHWSCRLLAEWAQIDLLSPDAPCSAARCALRVGPRLGFWGMRLEPGFPRVPLWKFGTNFHSDGAAKEIYQHVLRALPKVPKVFLLNANARGQRCTKQTWQDKAPESLVSLEANTSDRGTAIKERHNPAAGMKRVRVYLLLGRACVQAHSCLSGQQEQASG